MADRESRIQSALRAYESSSWSRATEEGHHGAGLCKRASLVCLDYSTAKASRIAELWHLGLPKEGSGFASSDEHYVVVIGEEAIDATARQFAQTGEPITRRSLKEVAGTPSRAKSYRSSSRR
jgi:hypothetical protein